MTSLIEAKQPTQGVKWGGLDSTNLDGGSFFFRYLPCVVNAEMKKEALVMEIFGSLIGCTDFVVVVKTALLINQ